jgi:hypothetical protein
MLTVTLRKTMSAALLTASLATLSVACDGQHSAADAPNPSGSSGAPSATTSAPPATPSTSGTDSAPASTPPSGPPSTTSAPGSPGGGTATNRVVYFSTARVTAGSHQVLHSRAEVDRFARTFAASAPKVAAGIESAGAKADFTHDVLVGWTASTGCSVATAASLEISGNRLTLKVDHPKPPPECLTDNRVVAVFEVTRDRVPQHPSFG